MPHRYGKKYREAAAAIATDGAFAPPTRGAGASCAPPPGPGPPRRIAVFATGEKAKEALDAGADLVGGDDLVKKVQAGEIDFDIALATPDLMGAVGRLGKVLGPRGLMPNPKAGTVTFDIANAGRAGQGGRVEFRVDRAGIIHTAI